MRNTTMTFALAVLLTTTAGCKKADAPATAAPAQAAMSEADAVKVADATVSVWTSMDAAKIKALYAPTVEAYDYAAPTLAKDRGEFDKRQDMFAASKLDAAQQVERKIQVLSPDVFVMSGTWNMTSSTKPANNGAVRCTDVFEKDSGGNWPIVNEHCSLVPKSA